MNNLINPVKFSLACITLMFLSACNGGGGSSGGTKQADSSTATTDARPIANAGADQVATEGHLVTLIGGASYDPEGTALIYQWRQISGTAITLSSEADDTPSFIAPNGSQTLAFQLVTDDGVNLSIADSITITVITVASQNTGNGSGNTDTGTDTDTGTGTGTGTGTDTGTDTGTGTDTDTAAAAGTAAAADTGTGTP
jgi:hypothetical protein